MQLKFLKKTKYICLYLIVILPLLSGSGYAAEAKNAFQKLPKLSLNDLNDKPRLLSDWQGKVILLNFWATWCGPCQTEIPSFIKLQKKYGDRGLQIIGVGLDEVRKLKNFMRTTGINYPILQADPDQQYGLLNQWGDPFGVLPYSVVIDRSGKLVFMQMGIFSEETFDRIIRPLLSNSKKQKL